MKPHVLTTAIRPGVTDIRTVGQHKAITDHSRMIGNGRHSNYAIQYSLPIGPELPGLPVAANCACCGAPAEYVLTDPTDASSPRGTLYCGPCTTATAAGFEPIAEPRFPHVVQITAEEASYRHEFRSMTDARAYVAQWRRANRGIPAEITIDGIGA